MIEPCYDFEEYPRWRDNPNKKIGVTWNARCSFCGIKTENKSISGGGFYGIESDGRKFGFVSEAMFINGQWFKSEQRKIACSKCCPVLLNESKD
jgi:hypothetical protein